MIIIVASRDDFASKNITTNLQTLCEFSETKKTFQGYEVKSLYLDDREMKLLVVNGELIYLKELPNPAEIELAVFLSRHQSKSGAPILSVHAPGNIGNAKFGGLPREVSIAPANAMRAALLEMNRQQALLGLSEFQVYYEGTHHGPSLKIPCIFVEIGSSLKEWQDPRAGEAVARAVIAATESTLQVEAAVGVGGAHYNRRLTRLSLESKIAFGHIIPSYNISLLNSEIIKQCVERTLEKDPTIVLDWKGIEGKDRLVLQRLLDELSSRVRLVTEYL